MKQGIVSKITETEITVNVKCSSACHECSHRDGCSLSEIVTKQIVIPIEDSNIYQLGQLVELEISNQSMCYSILYAYVLPLFLVVGTLVALSSLGYSETTSALWCLIILIPYYTLLSKINSWLKNKIRIKIK
jgi:positive regulator of sigma E activity